MPPTFGCLVSVPPLSSADQPLTDGGPPQLLCGGCGTVYIWHRLLAIGWDVNNIFLCLPRQTYSLKALP